ncbi:MAG: BolA family protein [Mariprofundus sp.]|nr:BolA family protein [Mariprofundus sp.]
MNKQNCQQLQHLLTHNFQPQELRIEDDSWKHAGHSGVKEHGGGHYTVHIAAAIFAGKRTVECHRMINTALASMFPKQIHALSIEIIPSQPV